MLGLQTWEWGCEWCRGAWLGWDRAEEEKTVAIVPEIGNEAGSDCQRK